MKTILVCSQKGGTGKTLLSDELAYSFERSGIPYAFMELDTQGGNQHQDQNPEDAQVAVIDTPGYFLDNTAQLVASADVLVVPCRASMSDQEPFLNMREMIVNNAPHTPVIVVQNFWNGFRVCKQFHEWLEADLRNEERLITLRNYEAYTQAPMYPASAVTYAPHTAACENMQRVLNMIRKAAGFEPEEILEINKKTFSSRTSNQK